MLRWWFPVLFKSRHYSWLVNYYVKHLRAFAVINILHIRQMHGLWIIQRTYKVEVKLSLNTADTQVSNFCPDTSSSNGGFPCLPPVRPQKRHGNRQTTQTLFPAISISLHYSFISVTLNGI